MVHRVIYEPIFYKIFFNFLIALISSSHSSKDNAWALSLSEALGLGCISTIKPSAPATKLASESGRTSLSLPHACDGSTITGIW